MSTKSCPYLFIIWLYQEGQEVLDTQYSSLKGLNSDPYSNTKPPCILFKPQKNEDPDSNPLKMRIPPALQRGDMGNGIILPPPPYKPYVQEVLTHFIS